MWLASTGALTGKITGVSVMKRVVVSCFCGIGRIVAGRLSCSVGRHRLRGSVVQLLISFLSCSTCLSCIAQRCDQNAEEQSRQHGEQEGICRMQQKEIENRQRGKANSSHRATPSTILIADSFLGGIWSLSLHTKSPKPQLLFTDPAMNGTASIATGINGLRLSSGRDTLFFTNSAKGTFNRVPISPSTGRKTGNVEILVNGLAGPDDQEVDEQEGVEYVCNGALDQILEAPLLAGESVINATDLNVVAEVPGPTSVRWGRDGVLYASTIGGLQQWVSHNVTVGGAVYGTQV